MNPGRFFTPNMGNMGMRMAPMMGGSMASASRGMGLFGRIGNSLKAFNFSGFLSGANKTLNVVNQTIPLIRQAKPMVNNMRSMFRLAKAFGSETNSRTNINNNTRSNEMVNSNNVNNNNQNVNLSDDKIIIDNKNDNNYEDSYPNFFI